MATRSAFFWKKAPFLRMLIPFAIGIIACWYIHIAPKFIWPALGVSFPLATGYFLLRPAHQFRLAFIGGFVFVILFLTSGYLLAWYRDIRKDPHWFADHLSGNSVVAVRIDEPLVEKPKTWKALATVEMLTDGISVNKVHGKMLLYFLKDSAHPAFSYGALLLFRKKPESIRNSGNPGGFDFQRYCLFQGITHQVFLNRSDYIVLDGAGPTLFQGLLYPLREAVLTTLRQNIPDERAAGLAEALLIGYKNDLDRTLVQSYTNTGVVHIIAISGLHIGLIYGILLFLLKPLHRRKGLHGLHIILLLAGLWGFSILAGAQASVLRSALMFSCLAIGRTIRRSGTSYNTLALSAFILLCYDPYLLWDIGFQLSYVAVLSIMIFGKPVYNWWYIHNRLLDHIWQLAALAVSAQILTLPLSLFHFHQFPVYFLLTNVVAVPVSSLIVIGEILLCCLFFIPGISALLGSILAWLIRLMNGYIQRIESLPGSLFDSLSIDLAETVLITLIIAGLGGWLMEKWRAGLILSLSALAALSLSLGLSQWKTRNQLFVILYNIPKYPAIDLIEGNKALLVGGAEPVDGQSLFDFQIKPSRIHYHASPASYMPGLIIQKPFLVFHHYRIMLLDSSYSLEGSGGDLDLLVVTNKANLSVKNLAGIFHIRQIVLDGSLSQRQVNAWKQDCEVLQLPCHIVGEKGAFVKKLN